MPDTTNETTDTPTTSPTGAPRLPTRLVPWAFVFFGLVAVLAAAGEPLCTGTPPVCAALVPELSPYARLLEIVLGVGGLLGIASPGWRRKGQVFAVPLALFFVFGAPSLSGCAHGGAGAKAFASRTFDCASPAIATQAGQAVPAVLDALSGSTNGWSDALDHLVLSLGDVAICAVQVAVAELQSRPPAPVNPTSTLLAVDRAELQLARGRRFLTANGLAQ